MIDAGHLLADLQRLLKILENDLRQRCQDNADVNARVLAEYNKAKAAGRTSQAYEVWRDEFITQVAVAWILACVFVRFIEDNQMLDDTQSARVWLAGSGARLQLARDQHTIYFREHPTESDREYLENVFCAVANPTGKRPLSVVQSLFDEKHNPLWRLGLSGDGATTLLTFWQQLEPETGALKYDFTDEGWNTRFLGDLYQDLSEAARKKYALLQTPVFVEEFILDRTLTPAINEFGYQVVRLIDPACGSGHFLLGAFERLFGLWVRNEPGVNSPELARRALSGVYGVDLNPFAVAIARFRLLVAALKAAGIERLQDAPAFEFNLAVGDSLLHGPARGNGAGDQMNMLWSPMAHVYAAEDKEHLDRILVPGRYHAVVGNPPYITPKDAALNKAYRDRFGSCHGKYSLAVPFTERFFDLAIAGNNGDAAGAGYVGLITSNSFMKREFGKKLIEQYIPRWDLTHIIDTSGAYIPGHATPTVILLGRHQRPVSSTVRVVMSNKGEPSTPPDPSRGMVWSSITRQVDLPGSQTEFVDVADSDRNIFSKHPWSIGGGGATGLKLLLDNSAEITLKAYSSVIGVLGMTNADEAMIASHGSFARRQVESRFYRPLTGGTEIRDWTIANVDHVLFPYVNGELTNITESNGLLKWLWPCRVTLGNRATFSKKTYFAEGRPWWEWHQIALERIESKSAIVFPNIATHNHFAVDETRSLLNVTAMLLKLPDGSSSDDYQFLNGFLNSSSVCFWMKQVSHQKQMTAGDGVRIESKSKVPYQYSGTQLGQLPLPLTFFKGKLRPRLLELSKLASKYGVRANQLSAVNAIAAGLSEGGTASEIKSVWSQYLEERTHVRSELIFLQEEIDFTTYCIYGLVDETLLSDRLKIAPVVIEAGERPFNILHGSNADGFLVPADIPATWPNDLRSLWKKRIEAITASPELSIVEDSHYKRRWIGRQGKFNLTRNAGELVDAAKEWLLNRLEDSRWWSRQELSTTARLADRMRTDREFMQVAELYRGRSDFDVGNLVAELVKSEAVPFLPVLRYKASGLRNRQIWEQVWEMQRDEDAIDARTKLPTGNPRRLSEAEAKWLKAEEVGNIAVPPKYKSTDFLEGTFWRLRGKLDVPKERFVSYPRCERDADSSLVIAWAGWNHLQQTQAVASYYQQMKTNEGWGPTRLVPLLAGIVELLPWLMQWHNEVDPAYGIGMGDFFKGFVEEEARALGLTLNKIREWTPSEKN